MTANSATLALRIVMLSGGVLAGLALVAINAVLPAIDTALAHSPRDSLLVKQMLGAVGLAMVAGAPLGGFLVDRLGLRGLLVCGGLLYTVAGTAGLYLQSLPLLVASRLAIGITAGALQVISLTVINTRLVGQLRARWMGLHISVAMLSTLAIQPAAGSLGNLGWRWPFALYFLGLLMVPVGLMQAARSQVAEVVSPVPDVQPMQHARSLLAVFPYHYLPFAMAIGTVVFVPTVYLPFILRDMGFGSPLLISLVLTADSIAGTVMALLYGPARRHLTTHGAFMVSFSLTTIGMVIALLSHQSWLFIGGVMIYGIGVGWLIANLITALSDKVAPAQQGRAAGFVKAAHFASAPVGIVLIESIVRQHGPVTALTITAVLSGCLLVLIGLRYALQQRPAG
jgi:MFS family permease